MAAHEGEAQDAGAVSTGTDEEAGVRGSPGAVAFALTFFLVALYAVVIAFDFHPSARTLPHIVGFPTLLVATVVVAREIAAWRRRRRGSEEGAAPPNLRSEIEAIGWFLGYSAAVLLLGFAIASPIFLVLFLKLYGKEGWLTTVLVTAGVTGIFVVFFSGVLNVGIYEGYLPGALGS